TSASAGVSSLVPRSGASVGEEVLARTRGEISEKRPQRRVGRARPATSTSGLTSRRSGDSSASKAQGTETSCHHVQTSKISPGPVHFPVPHLRLCVGVWGRIAPSRGRGRHASCASRSEQSHDRRRARSRTGNGRGTVDATQRRRKPATPQRVGGGDRRQ